MSINNFTGQCVVITGAASGMGRATAERFAAAGAFVVLADLDAEKGQAAADAIGRDRALFVRTDVSREEDVAALIAAATKERGRIDCLFNNAGVFDTQNSILEFTPDSFRRMTDILLMGPMLGTKHVAPVMRKQGGGVIINTTSVTAMQAAGISVSYSVAKAGLVHFTTTAAAELGKHSIRVNAVCPGGVLTGMVRAAMAMADDDVDAVTAFEQMTVESQLLPIPGQPEYIADAVLFLASDAAKWITGQNLVIDGGNTIAKWRTP